MQWKEPQDNEKYQWTEHSKYKMRQYGLSAQRILRIIRSPKRTETGIVEKTIAVMQPSSLKTDKEGKRTWGQEIWVMYQIKGKNQKSKVKSMEGSEDAWERLGKKIKSKKQIRIISAWKYPGVSPKNDPIPQDIMREIEEIV